MSDKDNASEIDSYSKEHEDLFISFMMSKPDLFVRCKGIIKSEYFDNKQNRDTVAFIESYSTDFSSIPSLQQIKALTKKEIEIMEVEAAKHDEWFLREFERFCRHKALRDAILASPDKLDKGMYGEVEAMIKAAVQIALVKDLGTDYYANPKERLEAIREGKGQVSTGWKTVDDKLYGGFNKGEITIFAGQSGAGKSLFLQNLAVNWALAGMNVVYLSLELSEKLCCMRIDAMHTGFETREVMRNIDDVHMKVRAQQQKSHGTIRVKQLPNGCTSNDIRAFIKEYEIQTGIKVDAILVDYLDLMMPMSKKISAENLFVKDKYITEELRNLSVELQTVTVSASQLNRGSYEQIDFDPSHIAGGISKVNTADNVISIFTSAAMKEAGRYQIQFMKTRSSSGVGSKVDLSFNNKSLRITDLEEGADDAVVASAKNIYEQLKKKSVIRSGEKLNPSTGEITRMTQNETKVDPIEGATALREMLKRKS
ncbi:MAG TPA: DnaB-like helicase C-terminal domain-containing protein [Ignavibacteriaceae bacterium]